MSHRSSGWCRTLPAAPGRLAAARNPQRIQSLGAFPDPNGTTAGWRSDRSASIGLPLRDPPGSSTIRLRRRVAGGEALEAPRRACGSLRVRGGPLPRQATHFRPGGCSRRRERREPCTTRCPCAPTRRIPGRRACTARGRPAAGWPSRLVGCCASDPLRAAPGPSFSEWPRARDPARPEGRAARVRAVRPSRRAHRRPRCLDPPRARARVPR